MLGLFAYLASGGIHGVLLLLVNMEALACLMELERKPREVVQVA